MLTDICELTDVCELTNDDQYLGVKNHKYWSVNGCFWVNQYWQAGLSPYRPKDPPWTPDLPEQKYFHLQIHLETYQYEYKPVFFSQLPWPDVPSVGPYCWYFYALNFEVWGIWLMPMIVLIPSTLLRMISIPCDWELVSSQIRLGVPLFHRLPAHLHHHHHHHYEIWWFWYKTCLGRWARSDIW